MSGYKWWALVCLVGFFGGPVSGQAQQATSDEIVAACVEAMGGRDAIDSIETIRIGYTLPDHGGGSAQLEIKRPNMFRVGKSLVFDGTGAAILARPANDGGESRPAEMIDEEEWKDFEMEIGWVFPAFFDYPPAYRGIEFIDGFETHVLEVHLPLGARLTYFLETSTNLPLMLESRVWLRGNEHRYVRRFGDYRENGGVRYPYSFTYFSHHVKKMFTVVIDELEFNAPLPDSHFAVPRHLNNPN